MDAAIIAGQPNPYRPLIQGPVANPYGSPARCLDHTTAYDDDPQDIPQPELKDIAQPETPTLPVLKENEV